MGIGLGWTDEERVALCKAYLSKSLDPVKGADQSGPKLWASVVVAWKGLLAGALASARTPSAAWAGCRSSGTISARA